MHRIGGGHRLFGIGAERIGLGIEEGIEQLLLLAALSPLLAPLLLGSQSHQLLEREQWHGAGHKLLQTVLKCLTLLRRQRVVALRHHLRGQMKTGLLHTMQQAFSQHLQIQG